MNILKGYQIEMLLTTLQAKKIKDRQIKKENTIHK